MTIRLYRFNSAHILALSGMLLLLSCGSLAKKENSDATKGNSDSTDGRALSFSESHPTVHVGECGKINISLSSVKKDELDRIVDIQESAAIHDIEIKLVPSAKIKIFSDSACSTTASSLIFSKGSKQAQVFYKLIEASDETITFSSSEYSFENPIVEVQSAAAPRGAVAPGVSVGPSSAGGTVNTSTTAP